MNAKYSKASQLKSRLFRSSNLQLCLFITTLFIVLFGLAILGVAIFISLDRSNTPEIVGSYFYNASVYVVLFSIIFIFVITLLGYFAVSKRKRILLILYICLLIIAFLLCFCGGICLAVFPAPFQTAVVNAMNLSISKYYGKQGFITDAWDFMQSELRCCGVLNNGWGVYRGSSWETHTNSELYNVNSKLSANSPFYKHVPSSCCLTILDPLTGWPTRDILNMERCQNWQFGPPRFEYGSHNDAIYYRGCFPAIKSYLQHYGQPIAILALITSLFMICSIVYCVLLLLNMERSYKNSAAQF